MATLTGRTPPDGAVSVKLRPRRWTAKTEALCDELEGKAAAGEYVGDGDEARILLGG